LSGNGAKGQLKLRARLKKNNKKPGKGVTTMKEEFEALEVVTIRLPEGGPPELWQALKEARRLGEENGGKIGVVRLVGRGGHSIICMLGRDFGDQRRIDRYFWRFLEKKLVEHLTGHQAPQKGSHR
jgi:hypothetical protein